MIACFRLHDACCFFLSPKILAIRAALFPVIQSFPRLLKFWAGSGQGCPRTVFGMDPPVSSPSALFVFWVLFYGGCWLVRFWPIALDFGRNIAGGVGGGWAYAKVEK